MKIGVIGAGSFGTAIAQLLTENREVLIYARNPETIKKINEAHQIKDFQLSEKISGTTDLKEIGEQCRLIFPMIPSEYFRSVVRKLSPYVGPGHMMIHGTKGLDVSDQFESSESILDIKRSVFTMTEVIKQETSIIRTGALAGPNLAKEILAGQPAATVIASDFDEVMEAGRKVLSSRKFRVYGSQHVKGIELAGALKNVIAIATGLMDGLGFGTNMQALSITRGLREMIHVAKAVGAEVRPFLGTAGIGDLIATATSTMSRNFTFGTLLSQDKNVEEIKEIMDEVAEGYRTLKFAHRIAIAADLKVPMIKTLYSVVYEGRPIRKAMVDLIHNPMTVDVDFI